MTILILYASTEGQTRRIARHLARRLIGQGRSVALMQVADAEGLDVAGFDACILAASVHAGKYQPEMVDFARSEAQALAATRTLFLSVSLSAAGDDPEDWQGLRDIVAGFQSETGWTPGRVEHVAGAFRFSEYDFFKYWAMRWIASQKDETVDPREDREYTDWAALERAVDDWLAGTG